MTTPTSINPTHSPGQSATAAAEAARAGPRSPFAADTAGTTRRQPRAAFRTSGQWVLSRCFLGMDDHLARGAEVFQLVSQKVESGGQGVRITRDVDPRLVDVGLQKPRADRALRAELLDAIDRHVVDQPRLGAVGHDGQMVARDDDPVPVQIALEREVAGRRKKNGNAIELLAFQQLLHLAWERLPGSSQCLCTLLSGRTNAIQVNGNA